MTFSERRKQAVERIADRLRARDTERMWHVTQGNPHTMRVDVALASEAEYIEAAEGIFDYELVRIVEKAVHNGWKERTE